MKKKTMRIKANYYMRTWRINNRSNNETIIEIIKTGVEEVDLIEDEVVGEITVNLISHVSLVSDVIRMDTLLKIVRTDY